MSMGVSALCALVHYQYRPYWILWRNFGWCSIDSWSTSPVKVIVGPSDCIILYCCIIRGLLLLDCRFVSIKLNNAMLCSLLVKYFLWVCLTWQVWSPHIGGRGRWVTSSHFESHQDCCRYRATDLYYSNIVLVLWNFQPKVSHWM